MFLTVSLEGAGGLLRAPRRGRGGEGGAGSSCRCLSSSQLRWLRTPAAGVASLSSSRVPSCPRVPPPAFQGPGTGGTVSVGIIPGLQISN